MEEKLYTLIIYEHTDHHGRFIAFEIDHGGRRPLWLPAGANRHHAKHRECVFSRTRAADPVPDAWQERVFA